jgi:O-antigen/teichoic acid export membrane protein
VANVLVGRQFSGTDAESVRATALSARINLLVGCALGIGLVVVSPILVPLVYGADFKESVPALMALVPGIVTLAWARGIGAYFVRRDKPLLVSLLAFGAVAVNVALNLLLIPLWGIVGASLASSVAYFGYATASITAFTRLATVSWHDLVPSGADVRRLAVYLRSSRGKR